MTFSSRVGRLMDSVVPRSELLYRIGRRIVNRYQGDNNGDIDVNGERWLMQRVLPASKVVFDVGANVGEWALEALQVNPRLVIHCFEPSKATFSRLSAAALPVTVVLNNVGLGAVAEERTLFVFDEACGANSLYTRMGTETAQGKQESVTLQTADGYCESAGVERIDFMKLDVEGHELAALTGARGLLRDGRINLVQFEYGGTYIDARVLLKDMWEFVHSVNPEYRFYKLFPDRLERVPRYLQTLENFQYSNWVIAAKDLGSNNSALAEILG